MHGADLTHLVHWLLTAGRRRSWRGLIWCNRRRAIRPVGGAVARRREGRLLRLRFGGVPSRCSQGAGTVLLQRAECSSSHHGRGPGQWSELPCPPSCRGRLLAGGGEILNLILRCTGGAIQLQERGSDGPLTMHSADEQRSRMAAAVRLVAAGGSFATVGADLRDSQALPFGIGLGRDDRRDNINCAAAAAQTAARTGLPPASCGLEAQYPDLGWSRRMARR